MGLRFMPGVELALPGLPPVPDGTLGDRALREPCAPDLFKGPIERGQVLSSRRSPSDEMNDIIQYFPWNFWDQLVLRAQEGVSGLIPRQEYELMSFVNAWNRWPGFMRAMVDRAGGLEGIVELGPARPRAGLEDQHAAHLVSGHRDPARPRGVPHPRGTSSQATSCRRPERRHEVLAGRS